MSAYPRSRNPFADDGDEEEDEPQDWAGERERSPLSEADRRQRQLQQEAMRSAQSATDSSNRSLRLIYESEKMGTDTAEELMRQGEALRRTERMAALNESKEHEDKYQQSHPNLKKLDTSGFGVSGISPEGPTSNQNGYPWNQHLRATHQQLDSNLGESSAGSTVVHGLTHEEPLLMISSSLLCPPDEMSLGLSRLKNLGLGLQVELEDQDSSIDNLLGKVDRMDGKINATNQQIKSLK
ncbi:synaptosomal-associated protein 29-like [Scleropages formosus]|uniref:Synaptosomal-associated protein 29 n=1 Tax=Scleropages formosus TaxID=113540 RepID=A0A0P7V446_SCLFO|nr:synaptosomal-associated protein 29-like [Scleropages formosus]